jgi:4-alpha-glucanotransferase
VSVPELADRASGVLLHPTSLPGPHGCGDVGVEARRFVDRLAEAGQRWWQTLPVAPPGYGDSPYSAQSAFAGNPLLIALEPLVDAGLLDASELEGARALPEGYVDYARTAAFRARALRAAFDGFRAGRGSRARADLDHFCEESASWLDDWALFCALKAHHGGAPWWEWEAPFRDRTLQGLARARRDHEGAIARAKLEQHLFATQWRELRAHAATRGVGLIGDIPIFVAHDSADVWAHRRLFHVDDRGQPLLVSGVPPDYFSQTGQRWGNPLYRWARIRKSGYAWWIERLRIMFQRFDVVRLDHFIGFQRYWEVPAAEATAMNGRWMKGPGARFFDEVRRTLGDVPLIAEDLGCVTPAVTRLRDSFRFPGIKILQFAFGTDPSAADFLPHSYTQRAVVYTGTHDNDTTVGWFNDRGDASGTRTPAQCEAERLAVLRYVHGRAVRPEEVPALGREIHWDLIRLATASVAHTAIFPLADVLGLGSEARMNHPGRSEGNWTWRFERGALTTSITERLRSLTATYGRDRAGDASSVDTDEDTK